MPQNVYRDGVDEDGPERGGISEPQSFSEHQAALDATVFQLDPGVSELVLELDSGELRVRRAT